MFRLKLLLLIPAIFLLSCNGEVVEEVVESYPDGSPRLVHFYEVKGGVKEKVKEVQYHPDRTLFVEGEYKNNKRHGNWVVYYPNGNKWSEGSFNNGLNDGRRTTYHENGNVHTDGYYENGNMIGVWKFYSEDGKLVNQIDYDKKK
jgi:antitoxin component YwqK of YwqJK toxin-antitoxin module